MTETARATVTRPDPTLPAVTRRRDSTSWARLRARIYETRPLACPRCQGPMRLITFLTANYVDRSGDGDQPVRECCDSCRALLLVPLL